MSDKQRLQCCNCDWIGDINDTKVVPFYFSEDIIGTANVCPKCESEDFYKVNAKFGTAEVEL